MLSFFCSFLLSACLSSRVVFGLLPTVFISSWLRRFFFSASSAWILSCSCSCSCLNSSISSLRTARFSFALTAAFFTGLPTAPKKSIRLFLLISIINTKAISIIITIAPTFPNSKRSHEGRPPIIPPPISFVPSLYSEATAEKKSPVSLPTEPTKIICIAVLSRIIPPESCSIFVSILVLLLSAARSTAT